MSDSPLPIAAAGSPAAGGQYLSFRLADEEYGLDILGVREIRGWQRVTRIPRSPPFVLGVLNLRGAVVPVMDLRLRFGLPQVEYTVTTVTIVVAVEDRLFGVVVDAVSDVLDVAGDAVRPAPDFGAAVDTAYIRGLTSQGERMVMLLDAARLLATDEWAATEAALIAVDAEAA